MDDGTAVVSSSRSSFFRLAVPSVSRHLISVFPIFLFRSVSPIPPPRHPVPRPRLRPESAIFVCVSRRSWTGNGCPHREKWPPLRFRDGNRPPRPLSFSRFISLAISPSPSPCRNTLPRISSKPRRRNAFYPTIPCATLSFCPFTIVLSDFGHRSALESFDATRYMCS